MLKPKFPEPEYFGSRRHWSLSKLLAYEAAVAGEAPPAPLAPADEKFLTAAQVRQRYGNVSDMWLWRRLAERHSSAAEAA